MSKCEDCGLVFAIYGKPKEKLCSECKKKTGGNTNGNTML